MKVYRLLVLVFVTLLSVTACANKKVELPPNALHVVEAKDIIVYTTPDNYEHIICLSRPAITYSKESAMLDNPSCDGDTALIGLQSGKQISASVALNDYTPAPGDMVSVSYHFQLIDTDGEVTTTTFFDDCMIDVGDESPVYVFGRSAFSVIADELKKVLIVCKLGGNAIVATFTITPEQPK